MSGATNGVKFSSVSENFDARLSNIVTAGVNKAQTNVAAALKSAMSQHMALWVNNLTFSLTQGGSIRLTEDNAAVLLEYDLSRLFNSYAERYEATDPPLSKKYSDVVDALRKLEGIHKLNFLLADEQYKAEENA